MIDSDSTIKLSDFGAAKQFIKDFGQNEENEAVKLNEDLITKSMDAPYWTAPEV